MKLNTVGAALTPKAKAVSVLVMTGAVIEIMTHCTAG